MFLPISMAYINTNKTQNATNSLINLQKRENSSTGLLHKHPHAFTHTHTRTTIRQMPPRPKKVYYVTVRQAGQKLHCLKDSV